MTFSKILISCILLVCLVAFAFAEEAYFTFTTIDREEFTIKLTDINKIEKARKILSGEENDEIHLFGRIIKRQVPYNSKWSFHYDPDTIQFMTQGIEVCDATTVYVEDHLDEACGAFLPGCMWCPWTSRLLRETNLKSYTYNKVYNINQYLLDRQEQHHCQD
ncbi:unnamed protein product [Cunninghamella echinulata]